ncbi:MAG: DUF3987 domain-containing protein [Gemmataceae bacterium]|nr:DUF3987 domain-containing protein [Gemmataceae bacterium]
MAKAIDDALKYAARLNETNGLEDISLPEEKPWPAMDPVAYQGLAGEIVKVIGPETEADSVGLLASILTSYGNACGRGPHYLVGATTHRANLFCTLVGQSAKARKGTCGDLCEALFNYADQEWVSHHRFSGLSTGEGLAWLARDTEAEDLDDDTPNSSKMQKKTIEKPRLADDKRAFFDETELAVVLQNASRAGNNLSAMVRKLWDGKKLEFRTKNSSFSTTGMHGSITAHITLDELKSLLGAVDIANGFANRFLWLLVKRSKLLPYGGDLTKLPGFGKTICQGLNESKRVTRMSFSESASKVWECAYAGELAKEDTGLVGTITCRAEAQALRLAMTYALIGESHVIEIDHLKAALSVWDYARQSAVYIFGDYQIGLSGKILTLLRSAGKSGMSRTDISKGLSRHIQSEKIIAELAALKQAGSAETELRQRTGGGNPIEIWRLKRPGEDFAMGLPKAALTIKDFKKSETSEIV